MKIQTNNKNYLITNTTQGINFTLATSIPAAKRAKTLIIKNKNTKLTLNGHQIKALRQMFEKEKIFVNN
jgi:hypothetical protein